MTYIVDYANIVHIKDQMNPYKKEDAMKIKQEIILYTNEHSNEYIEEARERAKEVYDDEVSDAELWDFIAEDDRIYWDDFMDEVKFWDKTNNTGSKVVLHGTCGTWRGSFAGGQIFDSLQEAIEKAVDSKDYITIKIESDGEFLIEGVHHDGINRWYVKGITAKGMDYLNRFDRGVYNTHDRDTIEHLLDVKCYTKNIKLF